MALVTYLEGRDLRVIYEGLPVPTTTTILQSGKEVSVPLYDSLWNFTIELPSMEWLMSSKYFCVGFLFPDPYQDQSDPANWRFDHINLQREPHRAPGWVLAPLRRVMNRTAELLAVNEVSLEFTNRTIAHTRQTVDSIFKGILIHHFGGMRHS